MQEKVLLVVPVAVAEVISITFNPGEEPDLVLYRTARQRLSRKGDIGDQ
jgi:hypothetical protein